MRFGFACLKIFHIKITLKIYHLYKNTSRYSINISEKYYNIQAKYEKIKTDETSMTRNQFRRAA